MTRPGFALTALLIAMSGSLIAVRTANSQQLDGRVGGVKYGLCPLVSDELYDGGYGAHTCDVSYMRPESPRIYRSRTVPSWSLTHCSVCEWYRQPSETAPAPAPVKAQADQFLSGYDATYDKAVYGKTAVPPVSDDWAGWDWCEGECGESVTVAPAPAVAASVKKAFEQEPLSIEQYYSMYGGKRYDATSTVYDADNYGYAPVSISRVDLSTLVARVARKYSVRANWEYLKCETISQRDRAIHRLMVSQHWSAVAELSRVWQQQSQSLQTLSAAGAEKACGRLAVRTVAKSLNGAAGMLQNASRCLTQLVENPALEVSAASDVPDQR